MWYSCTRTRTKVPNPQGGNFYNIAVCTKYLCTEVTIRVLCTSRVLGVLRTPYYTGLYTKAAWGTTRYIFLCTVYTSTSTYCCRSSFFLLCSRLFLKPTHSTEVQSREIGERTEERCNDKPAGDSSSMTSRSRSWLSSCVRLPSLLSRSLSPSLLYTSSRMTRVCL